MPTGYTNSLDETPEMTTQQWIMEHLARAFGVCVTLRDDSFDLSEEEILRRLSNDSSVEHHQEALKKANQESKAVSNRTTEAWKKLWKQSEAEKTESNNNSIAKAESIRLRHNAVKSDLQKIFVSSKVSETTKNIAKYGIDQLNTVHDYDCKPYVSEPTSFEVFVQQQRANNLRDISYHTKELEKAKDRVKERVETYKRLREDVNLILSLHSTNTEVKK